MYADAKAYLRTVYSQSEQVFSVASPFGQLLQVIIDMGQMMFYYIEDSITELNLSTATRPASIQGNARMTGHNPVRSIAATGSVRISYADMPEMYGSKIIIPNGTRLNCTENNLIYIIDVPTEDVRIEMQPLSYIYANIKQGIREESVIYTGTGAPLQSFNVASPSGREIDMEDIRVYVNGTRWKVYDSLYDMSYGTEGCLVKTSLTDGIDVFFGNNYYGLAPAFGDQIRVEFTSTLGSAGNITNYEGITFKFLDPCYDMQGNEIDVKECLSVTAETPISYGSDAEPLYLTKLLAPKMSRSFVLANTDAYTYFLERFNYFSYIHAYTTFDDNDNSDDNVIYLMLIPDINKRKNATDNYFTVPQSSFLLTDAEKNKVLDLIEKSGQKMLGVVNTIVSPEVKRYALNISIRIFENYSEGLIRSQIISKVSDYMLSNQRRDRIPKSDIIAIVEGIEGVDSVNVWFVSEDYESLLLNSKDTNAKTLQDTRQSRFDDFGDIVLNTTEIALIRGGWYDRTGTFISDTLDDAKQCACNVMIEDVIPDTYNSAKHQIVMKTLK